MDTVMREDAGPSNPKVNGHHSKEPSTYTIYPVEGSSAVIVSSHISGTQDLVTRFGLGSAYDQYVRPYTIKVSSGTAEGELDAKGKGKGVDGAEEPGEGAAAAAVAQGAMTKEKAKMMKKHYTHMIADVPGQNKLAKDHHLRDLLRNPEPPDGSLLVPFDAQAMRDAFSLELGTIPDFDTSIWRADAGEERKKKKKRRPEEAQNGPAAATNGAPSPATVLQKKRKTEQ